MFAKCSACYRSVSVPLCELAGYLSYHNLKLLLITRNIVVDILQVLSSASVLKYPRKTLELTDVEAAGYPSWQVLGRDQLVLEWFSRLLVVLVAS